MWIFGLKGTKFELAESMITGLAVAIAELRICGLKGAKFELAKSTGAAIIGPAVVAITESSVFSSKGF